MRCHRCHEETSITMMSMFNTETLCSQCKTVETKHPKYDEALAAECAAVKSGDFNFPGIGMPEDLRVRAVGAIEPSVDVDVSLFVMGVE